MGLIRGMEIDGIVGRVSQVRPEHLRVNCVVGLLFRLLLPFRALISILRTRVIDPGVEVIFETALKGGSRLRGYH